MQTSYVKLIFIREFAIPYVKYLFRTPRFHMRNFESAHFTCELGISYVNICENAPISHVKFVPIPYVFTCEMTSVIFVSSVGSYQLQRGLQSKLEEEPVFTRYW